MLGKTIDDSRRGGHVQHDPAAEKILGIEPPKHDMRIGHCRSIAAMTVCRRTRPRAGAFRANPEGTGGVTESDRAATGADGVNIQHWGEKWKAGDRCVSRRSLGHTTSGDDADIRTCTTDIEGDDVIMAGKPSGPGTAENAGGRPGQQCHHRPCRHHRCGGDAGRSSS